MPYFCGTYNRLEQAKYSNGSAEGDEHFGGHPVEEDPMDDDLLGYSMDFQQPKTSRVRNFLKAGCLNFKKNSSAITRFLVKFMFGRWPVALLVLIIYIALIIASISFAVTGRYQEFREDISLNSFVVPDIKVSREYTAFKEAKSRHKGFKSTQLGKLFNINNCPKNDINYPNMRVPRRRRDTTSRYHYNEPQTSISWTLNLVYVAKGSNDTNMLTKERLRVVHDFEKKLMKHPGYQKHCYISHLSNQDASLNSFGHCTPPNSLTAFFFPSKFGVFDGQGEVVQSIDETLKFLHSRTYFYSYVSEDYNPKKKYSKILRAQLLFGKPVEGVPINKEAQKENFKRYLRTFIEPLEKFTSDEVTVLYGGGDLFDFLVERALYSDLRLAVISLVLIVLLLLVLTFSLWLTFMAVVSILASVALAYFFYHVVFNIKYMGILNGVSLFVIIGIGVDDIFVFINTFRQAVDNKDLGDRIYHTISVAGKATLFTSFTTAAAFAANALSPIPAIHDFGLFMAILVASCWVSVLFIMSSSLSLWHAGIENLESTLWHKMLFFIGLRRSERLRLPDDIRQFLSGTTEMNYSEQSSSNGHTSDPLELQCLISDEDDDDDQLLVIENESPSAQEEPADTFGFRFQSILYHYVAEPVIKAKAVILVVYVIVFGLSIFLLTKLKVSTEQPKFFKENSNLQRWLELPDVLLHPSGQMANDLNSFLKKQFPSHPTSAKPTVKRPAVQPQTERRSPTIARTTKSVTMLHRTDGTTRLPVTRRTVFTKRPKTTSKSTANPPTTQPASGRPSTQPSAISITTENDHQTTSHWSTAISPRVTYQKHPDPSIAIVMSGSNWMSSHNHTVPTLRPLKPSEPVNPCRGKHCGIYGQCVVNNGTAACECQAPYTGKTCSIYCPVRTMDGNCCSIPFIYHNKQQFGCRIDDKPKSPWCSLTNNYDKDRRRGVCNTTVANDCEVRTIENNSCCVFPFVYKMVQYYYCTKIPGQGDHLMCGTERHPNKFYKCNITKPPPSISKLCPKPNSCGVAKKPADGTTALVYLVFGIKGIDIKSIDRGHVIREGEGNVVYDEDLFLDFSCNPKETAKAVCKICKKIASNSELVRSNGAECFPSRVRKVLAAMFPEDCGNLPKPLRTEKKYNSIVAVQNGTKLKWFAMAFESMTGKLSSYTTQQKDYMKWEKFIKEVLSDTDIPRSLKTGFQTSETWVKMFSGMIVVESAVYGIVVSLALCLAAVVIFTGHALLFVVLFMTILGVLLMVTAIFYLTGWQLGGVEAVSLSILVGTSVDYCFHLVEGYILAGKAVRPSLNAKQSRQWRAKAAMSHIGMSIISSAITTILAAIPLCVTQIQLFAKFGLIVTINTGISLLYTMTVTMAMLSTFGPARFRASICACVVGIIVVAACGGIVGLIMYLVSTKGGVCIPSPQGTPLFQC